MDTSNKSESYESMMLGAGAAFVATYTILKIDSNEDPKILRTSILISGIALVFLSQILFKSKSSSGLTVGPNNQGINPINK